VIDGVEKGKFDLRCKPFPADVVDAGALEVNGITPAEIESYPEPKVVYHKLNEILVAWVDRYDKHDKFQFVGYNATFDDRFLREFWRKNGDKYHGSWFWWPPIDVAVLAANHLGDRRSELVNFKLTTLASYLGVSADGEAHDASWDIEVTRRIYEMVKGGQLVGSSG